MKNPRLFLFVVTSLLLVIACKGKKKKTGEDKFFPVLSFIKSQVKHVDTSLYTIMKITYVDTSRSDTAYYKREQFRELATDFLNLPDLAESKYEDRYTEKKTFDQTIDRFIYIYEPLKPEKEVIKRQEVLVRMSDNSTDDITNIIINYALNTKDSLVEKTMLWQTNKSFQITTTRQLPGQPETTTSYKVIWNPDEEQYDGSTEDKKEEKKVKREEKK